MKSIRLDVAQTKDAQGNRVAVLWRNNNGVDTANGIRYGLGNGSADLVGFLIPSGKLFAIEVKTSIGKLSADQRTWIEWVNRNGGVARVARSVEASRLLLVELNPGRSLVFSET